jgi:hypothetical protein
MATYQDQNEVTLGAGPEFKQTWRPGTTAPYSGIYMCINCRDEDACNKGDPLPPQNHRQHPDTSKPIMWRLLVKTQPGPNA